MPEIRILNEQELRACVSLDAEAVAVVEQAFARLAGEGVVMPPVLSMHLGDVNGEVDVKTAYVPGLDGFAVKISPGFFDNPKLGLASLNGLMVVLSARTGLVEALLLDNGYLTDVRTAAAGAVAAKHLAPRRVHTLAVLGAGVQAELQVRAAALARDVDQLLVWARDLDKAKAFAARVGPKLGVPATALAGAEECVAAAELVITTTPSAVPLFAPESLHPGLHITAMGSDAAGKNEIDPKVIAAADRVVCDRRAQSEALGELRAAIAAGVVAADCEVDELGEICAGLKPGRRSDQDITVCDLTGTGVQDTAIAAHARARAAARGLGTIIVS